ncbi:hypothetical protein [Tersicoccus solisilvae]|uniref:hypothetical protein n=1 Tax=Tersicoccus solisilvae TaxID=1882339 RepID=UPI001669DE7F|nr:hypothetical protein [Tersicoccus solisilvae]
MSGALRAPFTGFIAVVGAVCLALCTAGYLAGADLSSLAGEPGRTGYAGPMDALTEIALRNGSAALGLLAGIVTFGLFSGVLLGVICLYFGVLARIALDLRGSSWWWEYLPFASVELLGFLVIASGGMYPAVRSIAAVLRRPPRGGVLATILRTYLTTTGRLLVPLAVGVGLLVLASVLEILWGVTYS